MILTRREVQRDQHYTKYHLSSQGICQIGKKKKNVGDHEQEQKVSMENKYLVQKLNLPDFKVGI